MHRGENEIVCDFDIQSFKRISDVSGFPISILGNDGVLVWCNKAFMNFYQSSQIENFVGMQVFALRPEPGFKEAFFECLQKKESIIHVGFVDFEFKWVQSTLSPFYENGKVALVVCYDIDITRLKESEVDLEQKSEHMLTLNEYLENANSQLEAQKIELDAKTEAIEAERQKFESLLSEILPFEVARQLISKGEVKPKSFKTVTVMFTDFKGFSKVSASLPPEELVKILHEYFAKFDDITGKHFIEKIKTIGDAYMCVGGLPLRNKSNPFNVVLAGLEIQRYMNELNDSKVLANLPIWELRLGIHTGEVVAGVVGKKKFAYDIWGDTVNIAARMETAGHVGMVNISGATYEYIKDYFDCSCRGAIEVKNRGEIDMYFVNGIKPQYSLDGKGIEPNEDFLTFLRKL